MGLDQYAYVAAKSGQYAEYYSTENYDKEDSDPTKEICPRSIADWRKHPNLHGWMEGLWIKKNLTMSETVSDEDLCTFNGVELELTWEDLEDLERAVIHQQLPDTAGFFFGGNSDEYYYQQDLDFIKNAKAEIFLGLKVFYNSSW